jgi:hypothetical protein
MNEKAIPPVNEPQVKIYIYREGWPQWMRDLPKLRFPPEPMIPFTLIEPDDQHEIEKDYGAEEIHVWKHDMDLLEQRLMRHFRTLNYQAAYHQNRYRVLQIMFMFLAFLATLVGSLLALSLNTNPHLVPILGLVDTILALITTYVATVGYRVDSHAAWLENRNRAEQLRREYFRFLLNLPPYDEKDGYERDSLLAQRAARIRVGEVLEEEIEKNE